LQYYFFEKKRGTMRKQTQVAVIIPVLNEEATIGTVLDALPSWVDHVLVADNGSTDMTVKEARSHGATVVHEPRRGYGSACLRAMGELDGLYENASDCAVVFLDGDFSDDPLEIGLIVDPIANDQVDFVIGSRTAGNCERGALTVTQRFGNWLSCSLMSLLFDVTYTDLGPFRAARWSSLKLLKMDSTAYGWTVQMQVRAALKNLRILEVPVSYRCRAGGKSKVSGTLRGIVGAGTTIIGVIFLEELKRRLCSSG
jgi:glycosyltransferase involved in cell wall biosynthesis